MTIFFLKTGQSLGNDLQTKLDENNFNSASVLLPKKAVTDNVAAKTSIYLHNTLPLSLSSFYY
jgi:hypothetical protein